MVTTKDLWLGSSLLLALLLIAIFGFFIQQARKSKEITSLNKYYKGISFFMLILGISGLIDFSAMYATAVLGKYDIFPYQFLTSGTTSFFIIITLILLGFMILSYNIETYIKQAKTHILTIILFICFIISFVPYFGMFIPTNMDQVITDIVYGTQIPFALIIVYWGIFYLSLAKNSTGLVRRKALFVAFGLGFLFFGIIMGVIFRSLVVGDYLLPFLFKVISLIGACFMLYGFKRTNLA